MRSAAMLFVASTLGLAGCPRGEPPAPAGIDASVAPLPPPLPVSAEASAASTGDTTVDAGVDAASVKRPEVDAGDTGALPQTKDRPKAEGAAFESRSRALWDAIVKDEPDVAMPFFFPVSAYLQVKDVGSPASDWKHRLVSAFRRDIHALHAKLGDRPGHEKNTAKLVRFDVPDDRAKWVEPDEEYNKLGYWRVYGTRIVYTSGDSTRERSFEVSSLISWRGEWFVVHLTGFK